MRERVLQLFMVNLLVPLFLVSPASTASADWSGGHAGAALANTSRAWFFAEGTTRTGFDEWLCVLNPGDSPCELTYRFLLPTGEAEPFRAVAGPHSRFTLNVGGTTGPGLDVSVLLESGAPVAAERAMYFRYGPEGWAGGHCEHGADSPSTQWFFAEGTTRAGFDKYICILNPNPAVANVQASCMDQHGRSASGIYAVGARSRITLPVRDMAVADRDVSVSLSSDLPIVAERPLYFAYRSSARVTIAVVGDVNLDLDQFRQGYGYAYPWTQTGGLLGSADLAFCNLECAVSHRGSPAPGKAFTFPGSPEALPAMREAGIDVVSHANNHARDWGAEALMDTFDHLAANGIALCGSGPDYAAAHSPAFLSAGGLRVAFLAYNDVNWPGWPAGAGYPGVADAADTAGMARDIAAAKERADVVAVSFHWGIEKEYNPTARQRQLARFAVDCGADLVLGHHPHVVQGLEIYCGKLICYSLGNFVFNPGSSQGHYTMLPLITMDSGGFVEAVIYPVFISSGQPQLLTGSAAASSLQQIADLTAACGSPSPCTATPPPSLRVPALAFRSISDQAKRQIIACGWHEK